MAKKVPDHVGRGYVQVSWRLVAVGATVLTVAATTTLIAVATTHDSDSLATVALYLAILAFVIQILVFVFDSVGNAQRDRDASKLNANTQALLAKIDERTNTTNEVLSQQVSKMMDQFIVNVKSNVAEDPSGSDDGERVAAALQAAVRGAEEAVRVSSGPPSAGVDAPRYASTRRRAMNLRRWPEESTFDRLLRDGLAELSEPAWRVLRRLAEDIQLSAENELPEGLIFEGAGDIIAVEELVGYGFVRPNRGGPLSSVIVLTSKGLQAAKLLRAPEPIPSYVEAALPKIREYRKAKSARS